MTLELLLRSHDEVEQLARLVWTDGTIRISSTHHGLGDDLKRIVEQGLHERVGPKYVSRITSLSDTRFLPRLEQYLEKQTGFVMQLSELE